MTNALPTGYSTSNFNLRTASLSIILLSIYAPAQTVPSVRAPEARSAKTVDETLDARAYVLGPQDSVMIKVHDADELGSDPYPIDLRGNLNLPLAGRVHAAGLTAEQLETLLIARFKEYIQAPEVTVVVAEFRSQPISILGQVSYPGIHQLRGKKTLFEVISEAGGLKPDAGSTIKITRRKENGAIPLSGAASDPSGEFSVAEISIRDLMEARNPQENIPVKPYDVITVPKAKLIYVIGSVKHAGGFVLTERTNMSVLQALSMAEGLERTAAAGKAKVIRGASGVSPVEIPVDVKKILDGKTADILLVADDILFIPNSAVKSATYRSIDAIIQAGTGAAIYRPF